MKKTRLILVVAITTVLIAGAGGGAAWWTMRHKPGAEEAHEEAAAATAAEKKPHKYVALDKVIVMLRRSGGEAGPHYLALDLVLKAPDEKEKLLKEHLPLLRSVAVKALSTYTLDKASGMTIDQFTEAINTAYDDSYASEKQEKPFSQCLIGKLIIE